MPKTFVLDTNVLIHDPRALFSFEENTVVIPEYVLMEIDKLKVGPEEKNQNAREAGRILRSLSKDLSEKIIKRQVETQSELKLNALPELDIPGVDGKLVLLMDDPDNRVKGEAMDDRILALVYKHKAEFKTPIIFVTKDNNLCVKAIARGFGAQDYRRDQAKAQLRQLPVLDAHIFPLDELFKQSPNSPGVLVPGILTKVFGEGDKTYTLNPGYYIIQYDGGKESLLHINQEERVRIVLNTPTLCRNKSVRGIKAKNTEQCAAVDSLVNPNKTLVCLTGPAGTGKTLLAIAAAIDMVRKVNRVNQPEEAQVEDLSRREAKQVRKAVQKGKQEGRMQILIARPMVSMGKEMGFLPGDMEEKMRPWIQPIVDNLKFILGEQMVEALLKDGTIELQPLQYIRGRSINDSFLIIDEAQNTTPLEIKTIITRAGKNCKVVLTGDPDQIDVPYLDKLTNGLTYAADRMAKEEFVAVIPLVKCERSLLAARAAELL